MKSTSNILLWIGLAVVIVAALVYFFARSGSAPAASNNATLVSTSTGTAQGLQSQAAANGSAKNPSGDQIVALLRNVSSIQLNDSLFQSPAFATLTDLSIALPAVTSQGRRNPFAAAGTDTMPYIAPVTTTLNSKSNSSPSLNGASAPSQGSGKTSSGANAPTGGAGF